MVNFSMNEWTVSGEVFYIKDLQGEFAASLRIRGVAKREGLFSSQILEFPCLMQKSVYEDAKKKGLFKFKQVTLSGHLESWKNSTSKNPKVMFIADYVIEVS